MVKTTFYTDDQTTEGFKLIQQWLSEYNAKKLNQSDTFHIICMYIINNFDDIVDELYVEESE